MKQSDKFIIITDSSEYYEGLSYVSEAHGNFHIFSFEKVDAKVMTKAEAIEVLNNLPEQDSKKCQIVEYN